MSGHDLRAGAVAVVTTIRHPVALARVVMEETRHVFLAGPGAERLATRHGLELMAPDWFVTGRQRDRWWRDRSGDAPAPTGTVGTVGAVVLDCGRPPRLRDIDGRHARPAARPDRRLAADRRRHLCGRARRGLVHRRRRADDPHGVGVLRWPRSSGRVCRSRMRARAWCTSAPAELGGDAGLIAVDRDGAIGRALQHDRHASGARVGDTDTVTRVWADDAER